MRKPHLVLVAVDLIPALEDHRPPLLRDELLVGRGKLIPLGNDLAHVLQPKRGDLQRPRPPRPQKVELLVVDHAQGTRNPVGVSVRIPDVAFQNLTVDGGRITRTRMHGVSDHAKHSAAGASVL